MNRLYEGMFLFDANLATREGPNLERHVQDLLTKHGATLVHSETWPDRKLAYEIAGCKKGTYYLTYFEAPPTSIDALRRDAQISERILRLLIIYDEALVEECERRKSKEVTGPPEEIEARREASEAQVRIDRIAAARASKEDAGGGADRPADGDDGGGDGDHAADEPEAAGATTEASASESDDDARVAD